MESVWNANRGWKKTVQNVQSGQKRAPENPIPESGPNSRDCNPQFKKPNPQKFKIKELSTREKLFLERDLKLKKLQQKKKKQGRKKQEAQSQKTKAKLGKVPSIKLREKIQLDLVRIREEIKNVRIEAGKDREQMKNLLRKKFLKSEGELGK